MMVFLKSTLRTKLSVSAFIHDLEERGVDVGMGLLDLVEEDDRVGAAADLLGQLAAFLVADVAGRSTDESRDVVLLHVLGHVDLDQGVGVAEHELGEGLGQHRLSAFGRTGEAEAADGALGRL